jgi:hypothetical protein
LEILEDRQLLSTFQVTSANDSGVGSLRWAITAVNNDVNPAVDTIAFSIPPGSMNYQTIPVQSALPTITHPVVIDGTTKSGYTAGHPVVVLDGSSVGAFAVDGLRISAGSSTVQGLVISNFGADGIHVVGNGGDVIAGNFIGTDVTGTRSQGNGVGVFPFGYGVDLEASGNLVGDLFAGNVISGNFGGGVRIALDGNLVWGNSIGVNAARTAGLSNGVGGDGSGVGIFDAPNNTVAYNVISSSWNGVQIWGAGATGNTVQGNYIGTDGTGTLPLPNVNGVVIDGASSNTIGGTGSWFGIPLGNLISGNREDGILIENERSPAQNNWILGNDIGTAQGERGPLPNGGNGIHITGSASNNHIGLLLDPGSVSNTIAYNGLDGVFVESGTGNAILSNAIYANGMMGIELGDFLGEIGNNLQPAPSLAPYGALILFGGPENQIEWSLHAAANTTYTVQFFDGKVYLGYATVTTDANGDTGDQFFQSSILLTSGDWVTATATDPYGNTSEFALAVQVEDFWF